MDARGDGMGGAANRSIGYRHSDTRDGHWTERCCALVTGDQAAIGYRKESGRGNDANVVSHRTRVPIDVANDRDRLRFIADFSNPKRSAVRIVCRVGVLVRIGGGFVGAANSY